MRSHTFRVGDALVFLGHKPHRVSPLRAVRFTVYRPTALMRPGYRPTALMRPYGVL
jgi:hypothetical protein